MSAEVCSGAHYYNPDRPDPWTRVSYGNTDAEVEVVVEMEVVKGVWVVMITVTMMVMLVDLRNVHGNENAAYSWQRECRMFMATGMPHVHGNENAACSWQ